MKDGAPFGIAGIWENWKEPASGEWIRTFAIITTDARRARIRESIDRALHLSSTRGSACKLRLGGGIVQ
jgi:putative SOS response-associated peptidase YedK